MKDATYDFGLAPGESFVPDDDIEIDRSSPHIMTVLGPIDPGALGPVNLTASFVPRSTGADIAELLSEIHECAAVGLSGLLDLRPIASNHEARAALWLAERCDSHLIVAIGIRPDDGLTANLTRTVEAASTGLFGTSVSPGVIVVLPDPEAIRIGEAAAEATGLPLIIDARGSGTRLPLAGSGARIAVDPSSADPERQCLLVDLAHRTESTGIAVQLQSIDNNSGWMVGYDPPEKGDVPFSRWNWLIEEFPIELLEAGLAPWQVRSLLIDAPAEFLTIHLPAPTRC